MLREQLGEVPILIPSEAEDEAATLVLVLVASENWIDFIAGSIACRFLIHDIPSLRKCIASLLLPQPSGPLALLLHFRVTIGQAPGAYLEESCSKKQTSTSKLGDSPSELIN
jgi:hypothetical protein